jgi:hypothetical protein
VKSPLDVAQRSLRSLFKNQTTANKPKPSTTTTTGHHQQRARLLSIALPVENAEPLPVLFSLPGPVVTQLPHTNRPRMTILVGEVPITDANLFRSHARSLAAETQRAS